MGKEKKEGEEGMLQGKGKEKDKAVGEEREEGRQKEKHEDSEEGK
jgi:hypothetical protein